MAEVAAALEAASAAIAAGPSNTDISDLPTAGAEQDDDEQTGDSKTRRVVRGSAECRSFKAQRG